MLELVKVNKNDHNSLFYVEKIIKDYFDENEYRDFPDFYSYSLNRDEFSVHLIKNKGQNIGILNTWEFENCIYIEHFAIEKSFRSRSFGSQVLKYLISTAKKDILLEVELPHNKINEKRIMFYKANNFELLDLKYYQEPLGINKNRVEMHLMIHRKTDKNIGMQDLIKKLKEVVYRQVKELTWEK